MCRFCLLICIYNDKIYADNGGEICTFLIILFWIILIGFIILGIADLTLRKKHQIPKNEKFMDQYISRTHFLVELWLCAMFLVIATLRSLYGIQLYVVLFIFFALVFAIRAFLDYAFRKETKRHYISLTLNESVFVAYFCDYRITKLILFNFLYLRSPSDKLVLLLPFILFIEVGMESVIIACILLPLSTLLLMFYAKFYLFKESLFHTEFI